MAEAWRVSKLDVDVRYQDDVPIIEAHGECDLITSRKLKDAADYLMQTGRNKMVFDLRDTTYIDSSGFRALLDARNNAVNRGGNIALVSLTAPVERVFSLLRLDEIIIRTDTVESAVEKLKSIEPTQC